MDVVGAAQYPDGAGQAPDGAGLAPDGVDAHFRYF